MQRDLCLCKVLCRPSKRLKSICHMPQGIWDNIHILRVPWGICVWEDVKSSQSVSGSIGSLISPHLGENLCLSAPQQETESSCLWDQGGVGPCLSAKETLKVTNCKQVTQGSSPSAQGTGGHSSSAQSIVGQSMSAKQTVGTLPPTPGPLQSTQNARVFPESSLIRGLLEFLYLHKEL